MCSARCTSIVDIVPTILEVAGIKAPKVVDGFPQKPMAASAEATSVAWVVTLVAWPAAMVLTAGISTISATTPSVSYNKRRKACGARPTGLF